jgi:uncharacterized protein YfbU (UPF0304 family)
VWEEHGKKHRARRMAFQLSKAERLILWHQLEILKSLHPERREDYEHEQTALQDGYEQDWSYRYTNLIADPLPQRISQEVRDILNMLLTSELSLDVAGYSGEVLKAPVFHGFDGNMESDHYAYARHLISARGSYDRWKGMEFNSHYPTLAKYLAMLREYSEMGRPAKLSAEQIERLEKAAA